MVGSWPPAMRSTVSASNMVSPPTLPASGGGSFSRRWLMRCCRRDSEAVSLAWVRTIRLALANS